MVHEVLREKLATPQHDLRLIATAIPIGDDTNKYGGTSSFRSQFTDRLAQS